MEGHKDNPQMKAFHDMLEQMDQTIMESGIENSLAWFKKVIHQKLLRNFTILW